MKKLSRLARTCIILAIVTVGCLVIAGVFSAIAYGSIGALWGSEQRSISETVKVEKTEALDNINLKGYFSEVTVVPAKGSEIEMELIGSVSALGNPALKQSFDNAGRTVTVELNTQRWNLWGNSFVQLPLGDIELSLKVYLPVSYTGKLSFDLASGDILVNGVQASELILNGASGNVSINSVWETLDVSGVTGDLLVDCTINDPSREINNRNINITGITGNVDINASPSQIIYTQSTGINGGVSYRINGKPSLSPAFSEHTTGIVQLSVTGITGGITVNQVD